MLDIKPVRDDTQKKFNVLIKDLVKHFGNNVEISRKQFSEFRRKNAEKYPSSAFFTKNTEYRVARGRYLVTDADDVPAAVATHRKMREDALSEEERQDATKLAKALTGKTKAKAKTKVAPKRKTAAKKTKVAPKRKAPAKSAKAKVAPKCKKTAKK
jgi:hypothetical protein